MPTDHISAVNVLLEAGDFTRFNEIFSIARPATVAREAGVHIIRLNRALKTDLCILTLRELFQIAEYFRISEALMLEIVLKEIGSRKRKSLK